MKPSRIFQAFSFSLALATSTVPIATAGQVETLCNGAPNGILDGAEQCEGGPCCTETCELKPAGALCRTGADEVCDPSETCGEQSFGVEAGCPADVFAETGTSCSDGSACTLEDTCDGDGACVGGSVVDCDDDNACTDDSCDADSGCMHDNNTAACDDGFFCTVDDTCSGGTCSGSARVCNDDNPCTTDACNEVDDRCDALNNTLACDDGLFCNGDDSCEGGECAVHAGDPCDGPDGDGDCAESCDEDAKACTGADADDSPCTDGNSCTAGDACAAGACVPGALDDSCATTTTLAPPTTTTLVEPTTTTLFVTTTTLLPPDQMCGDITDDGRLTVRDAFLILRAAVGLPSKCTLHVCDYTGDLEITSSDALAVLRAAVGLTTDPMCPPDEVETFLEGSGESPVPAC